MCASCWFEARKDFSVKMCHISCIHCETLRYFQLCSSLSIFLLHTSLLFRRALESVTNNQERGWNSRKQFIASSRWTCFPVQGGKRLKRFRWFPLSSVFVGRNGCLKRWKLLLASSCSFYRSQLYSVQSLDTHSFWLFDGDSFTLYWFSILLELIAICSSWFTHERTCH